MVRGRGPMLRVLGVTGLSPKGENRIIFYSILFIVIATTLYILTFYLGEPSGKKKGMVGKKQTSSLLRPEHSEPERAKTGGFSFSWQET
ncbi:MAG: hypothetical protein ABEH38_05885 [Flavobacteriales bacterium]